jgi:uncharacterized protein
MKWRGRARSGNVEDRRGMGGKLAVGGGLGGIVVLILSLLFGGNPLENINIGDSGSGANYGQSQVDPNDPKVEFVSVVLKDTEDVWYKLFQEQLNSTYQPPKLVVFTGYDQTGCGSASSATGPFYCPLDHKVYIDLSFQEELQSKFKAPGDFAMAYVIAHEVGHHIQNLLGINEEVRKRQGMVGKAEANRLSVAQELQADFLAGVWAHHAQTMKNILEEGDMEEALNAANAIGDDRIQMRSQGYVVPDAFTHGTSEQRMYWFKKGFDTGDINQGDTFSQSN